MEFPVPHDGVFIVKVERDLERIGVRDEGKGNDQTDGQEMALGQGSLLNLWDRKFGGL